MARRANRIPLLCYAVAVSACAAIITCQRGSVVTGDEGWELRLVEDFSYTSAAHMAGRWQSLSCADWSNLVEEPFPDSGGWRIEDSALVGYSHVGYYNLACRDTFDGDLRVEWDATPLRRNLNLNCFIAGNNRASGYTFHVAGWDNPGVVVLTKGASMAQVDNNRLPSQLRVGRTYRMRMERSGQYVRLWVDGKRMFDFRDLDDIGGPGHHSFGFENNNYNRIRIDNVKVWNRTQSLDVSPLSRAVAAYQRGHFPDALQQLRQIATQSTNDDTVAQALYRAARCLEMLDSVDAAIKAYEQIEARFGSHEVCPLSAGQRGAIYDARGDTATAMKVYREMGAQYPGHAVLRTVFFNMAHTRTVRRQQIVTVELVRDSGDDGRAGEWLLAETVRMRDMGRAFGVALSGNIFMEEMVGALLGSDVITVEQLRELLPECRELHAVQYVYRGAFHIVERDYRDAKTDLSDALRFMGRYSDALRVHGASRSALAGSLLELGRYQEVEHRFPDQRPLCASAAHRSGEIDRLLSEYSEAMGACVAGASEVGRMAEYFATVNPDYYSLASVLFDGVNKPQIALLAMEGSQVSYAFRDYLLLNDILRALGRAEEGTARCARAPQMEVPLAHNYLTIGRPDLAALVYPKLGEVRAKVMLYRGDFDSIHAAYPERWYARLPAFVLAGEYEQVLEQCGNSPWAVATALLAKGDLQGMLKRCPELRTWRAEALNRLGRHDEVLRKYPDRRRACARALIAKGRLDDALARYPESRADCATELLWRGQWEEVIRRFPDMPYEMSQALTELRRYGETAIGRGKVWVKPDQKLELVARMVLTEWRSGNKGVVDSVMAHPPVDYSYQWNAQRFSRFLLAPVLRSLDGDTATLYRECRALMENPNQMFSRRLWFEAAYLRGDIDDSAFLAQPCKFRTADRLLLFRAIRADVAGDAVLASQNYAAWLSAAARVVPLVDDVTMAHGAADVFTDIDESTTLRRFAQWRIEERGDPASGVQP